MNKKQIYTILLTTLIATTNLGFNNKQIVSSNIVRAEETKEQKLITYFENMKKEFDNSIIKEKADEYFKITVNFLFNGGSINNITLKELSSETKTKVISIANDINKKIESKYPDYKQDIKDATGKVITYTTTKFNNLITYLDKSFYNLVGENNYNNFKNDYNNMKVSLNKSKELIKKAYRYIKK